MDMVLCRQGYLRFGGFCREAPRCHVGQQIGQHCDCKDDAVDGRCGCQCRKLNDTCSCPYHAYLKSRVVTCSDGLHAAVGDIACVASWQNALLVISGVFIAVAAVLMLYFVYGVLRTAGLVPCRSNKACLEEDRRIEEEEEEGIDSELRQ